MPRGGGIIRVLKINIDIKIMNFDKPQEENNTATKLSPEENERNEKIKKVIDLYKVARDYCGLELEMTKLSAPGNTKEKNLDVWRTFWHEAQRIRDEFSAKFIQADKDFLNYLGSVSKKDADLRFFSADIFYSPLSWEEKEQKIKEVIE